MSALLQQKPETRDADQIRRDTIMEAYLEQPEVKARLRAVEVSP